MDNLPNPPVNPLPVANPIVELPAQGPHVNVNLRIPSPDNFSGERDAAKLRTWLFTYNAWADLHDLTERQKIAASVMFLKGPAANWWENRELRVRRNEVPRLIQWDRFVEEITAEFQPANYLVELRNRLHYIQQKTSVRDYATEFMKLCTLLPPMTEADLIDHFIRGLKPHTQTEVLLRHPQTLREAEEQALMVDDIHYRRRHQFNPPGCPNPPRPQLPPQPLPQPPRQNRDNMGVQPMELGNVGLRRLTDAERAQLRASGSCFKCRREGHRANECPSRFNNPAPQGNPQPRPQQNLPPRPNRPRLNNIENLGPQQGNGQHQ
jgi:Ty3 transposon capsid-like protein/Zinc knuckle